MNDISVKIVESPKEQVVVAEVLSNVDAGAENEVDPLAIDETETTEIKDPLVDEAVKKTETEVKADICDENAKDDTVTEKEDNDSIVLKAEIKEEVNEDINAINRVTEDKIESKSLENETKVSSKDSTLEPVSEPAPTEKVDQLVKVTEKETVSIPEVRNTEQVKEKRVSVEEKEVKNKVEEKEKVHDIVMIELDQAEKKIEKKVETKPVAPPVNGDIAKEEQPVKRRLSEEIETESPLKKLCQEVERTFPQHDTMINDYIQTATKNNINEIQRHTEQLLSEIQTLRELAQKKEHEWNNILHLKKVKEEILLRLLRRKQVLSFEKSAELNGSDKSDPFDYLNQAKNLAIDKSDEISGLAIKQPGSTLNPMMQTPIMPVTPHFNPMSGLPPPYDKAHLQNMPKPVFPQPMMMAGPTMQGFPRDMNGQLPTNFGMPMGRQGPTKDVKSIIADYRQRNPEITPRRGRRMKSILNPNMMNMPRAIAPKVDSMNNLNNLNNLNMLFNNLDMNQKAMLERLQQMQAGGLPNGLSFKDVLVQFANMQQSTGLVPSRPMEPMIRPEHHMRAERPENRRRQERNHDEVHKPPRVEVERLASPSPRLPPPPPYPEISLLPVNQETSQASQNSLLHGILTKNCGEITITPVQPTPPPPEPQPEKTEEVVQLDDEESAASSGSASGSPSGSGSGRLVIDEAGGEATEANEGEASEANEVEPDAPLCQGCRRRDAQFVCAGCANQWYCSRDCQVAAWDEHSEMCSG